MSELSRAECDVLAERERQKLVEGWTTEHDDEHNGGEIALAAAAYATWSSYAPGDVAQAIWPWNWKWFKPTNRRRDLVKAGALILAEIERLDRAGDHT